MSLEMDLGGVVVRVADARDGPSIARIYQESAAFHHSELDATYYAPAATDAIADRFITDGPMRRSAALLVADRKGGVVGFAELRHTPATDIPTMYAWAARGSVWIEELAVSASCRGQGIGSMLLKAAEAWARDRAITTIGLSTSVAHLRAQSPYETRHGYRRVGIIYTKELEAEPTSEPGVTGLTDEGSGVPRDTPIDRLGGDDDVTATSSANSPPSG